MPVLYKPYQSQLEDKKTKKCLFYPRAVCTNNVSTAQLSQEIATYSSLTPGDVQNTLENLARVMTQHLQSSESVTVDGIGIFRMTMNARGKGVETPEKVSAAQATLNVRFQPIVSLNPNRTVASRSLVSGAKCVRYGKFAGCGICDGNPEEEPGGFVDGEDNGDGYENALDGGNANIGGGNSSVNTKDEAPDPSL